MRRLEDGSYVIEIDPGKLRAVQKTAVYIVGYDCGRHTREELRVLPDWPNHVIHLKIGKTRVNIPVWTYPVTYGARQEQVAQLFKRRISQLQTATPHKLELKRAFTTYRTDSEVVKDADLESYLHRLLSPFRLKGEWFSFPYSIKWYEAVESAVNQFQLITHTPVTDVGSYRSDFEWGRKGEFCGSWIKCNHRPGLTGGAI